MTHVFIIKGFFTIIYVRSCVVNIHNVAMKWIILLFLSELSVHEFILNSFTFDCFVLSLSITS